MAKGTGSRAHKLKSPSHQAARPPPAQVPSWGAAVAPGKLIKFNTVWERCHLTIRCTYPCHTVVTIFHRPSALSQHGVPSAATVSAPVSISQQLRNFLLATPSLSSQDNGNKCSNTDLPSSSSTSAFSLRW